MNRDRPSVVFLCPRLPGRIGGDRLTSLHQTRLLARWFNVHLVCLTERSPQESDLAPLRSVATSVTVFHKPRLLSAVRAIARAANGLPLQVNYYTFPDVEETVRRLAAKSDLFMSRMIRTGEYGHSLPIPSILDMQDCYSDMYRRGSEMVASRVWGLIYRLEAERIARYENLMLDRFDRVLIWGDAERNALPRPDKARAMPHGVDERLFQYDARTSGYQDAVIFFGKLDYEPNVEAVLWFAHHVLPRLPGMRFLVVGARPCRRVLRLAERYPNVVVTGFVEDPYLILRSACCVVAPMRMGGGIQNKVLESLAVGALVVSSPLAIRGLPALCAGRDILVGASAEDFVRLILDVRANPANYLNVRSSGRKTVARHYTWELYGRELLKVIQELVPVRPPQPSA